MRWTLRVAALLAVLLAAYAVWPVVGFCRLASALEARDAAALSAQVDFRALRTSLTKQILATYLELSGKRRSSACSARASP
jgi:outer membrane protein TolC